MKTASPRVIKASAASDGEAATYNLIDLRHRFEKYASDVKEQCRSWIHQAGAESDAIRQKAYEEGRKAGYADGMKDAVELIEQKSYEASAIKIEAALATATPAVQEAAAALDEQRFKWLARWETAAVEMAITLTERLTARIIERDATVVRDRAISALHFAAGSSEGFLEMHPDDVAALGSEVHTMTSGTSYEVVANPQVERGGCVLRSIDGDVDAQLSSQIDRIVEELLGDERAGE